MAGRMPPTIKNTPTMMAMVRAPTTISGNMLLLFMMLKNQGAISQAIWAKKLLNPCKRVRS